MKFLKEKVTISAIKIFLDVISSRLESAEQKIGELTTAAIKSSKTEAQRGKKTKKFIEL